MLEVALRTAIALSELPSLKTEGEVLIIVFLHKTLVLSTRFRLLGVVVNVERLMPLRSVVNSRLRPAPSAFTNREFLQASIFDKSF